MKVVKMAKRLFAFSTGVLMLGATATGALAADLSNYPDMFVEDGKFNGYFVVGDSAHPKDNLAMTDMATQMWYTESSSGSTVNVEGDAWMVGTEAEWLELNESIGPSGTYGIVDYISDDELGALADGSISNSKGTFNYEQKLHFDAQALVDGPDTYFMENEEDAVGLYWKITDGNQIARYELDFTTDAETDIDASDSNALKDFEDKELSFMGTTWTMTTAKYDGSDGVQLTFMGGATQGTLQEGDSQTFTVAGTEYDVALTFVDADEAAFTVNGEATGKLEDGETHTLADGNDVGVSSILYQNYAGGVHQASFFIGANKLYLADTNITDTTYDSNEVKVNEETIDGMTVLIKGTMVTYPVSTTTDGELKLDYIHVNMTAQDDIYMGAGDKLSEDSELSEPQLLFTENWDFEFHGIDETVGTNDIKLKKAGDDKYELQFNSNDGNTVDLPLMYSAGSVIKLGKKAEDNFAMNPGANITDDDYFVLSSKQANTAGNEDAITTVLQYQSSKNSGDSTQTIKFKNLNTGETFERTFADDCTFDISLNGRTHTFDETSPSQNNCTTDNWGIRLSSANYSSAVSGNISTVYLRDASGALIQISDMDAASGGSVDHVMQNNKAIGGAGLNLSILVGDDGNKRDDVVAAQQLEVSYRLNYTATNEVTASRDKNNGWTVADPDDTDVTWGYTTFGSKLYHVAASSTPVEFTLSVPETAGKVVAYITSGATQSVSSGSGNLAKVDVVTPSKLASEIANVADNNLIVVGGACVNSVAAELLGVSMDFPACAEGMNPGTATVKLFENGENMAMLVAGYGGDDTRLAGEVIAHRWTELLGEEVVIEGTASADATIGAPTVVVEAEPEAEPAAEPETTTE
jgi:hypothetical protein